MADYGVRPRGQAPCLLGPRLWNLGNDRLIVVVDEAYVDYANRNYLHLIPRHEDIIIVRTMSKAWGLADARIGYAISRNPAMQQLRTEGLAIQHRGLCAGSGHSCTRPRRDCCGIDS